MMARGFFLWASLAVTVGLAALLEAGCSPVPDTARKTVSEALKTGGCQGCAPTVLGEGEGEGEGENEFEGEGEVSTPEEGEGEAPPEGEDGEPEPQRPLLDTYPGDGQVLVKWSCPNGDKISRFVLFRETESPLDSKGLTVDAHALEDTRSADKSAYTCEQVYSGIETAFVDRGLTNGQEYLYTLRGYDDAEIVICRGRKTCVPTEVKRPVRLVLFGESTTAPRDGVKVFGTLLGEDLAAFGIEATVLNEGRGGENTEQARGRFESAVLDREPDIVTLYYGLNDAAVDVTLGATEPRIALARFTENLRYFVTEIRGRGGIPILLTPNPLWWSTGEIASFGQPPYDVDDPDGHNLFVREYAAAVRNLATEEAVPLVDVYDILHDYADAHSFEAILPDGVHPNDLGHRMIADALLMVIPTLR